MFLDITKVFLASLITVIWPKELSFNSSHTENNDSNKLLREHSPDVIGAEIFFKMEKGAFAQRISA